MMDRDTSEVATAIWERVIQRRVIDWDLVEMGLRGTDSRGIIILGRSTGRSALCLGGQDGRTAAYGRGYTRLH